MTRRLLTGLTPDQVIAAHTGQTWTVACCGFAPGNPERAAGGCATTSPYGGDQVRFRRAD